MVNKLPVNGLEPWISGVGSNCSTNCATTTVQMWFLLFQTMLCLFFEQKNCFKFPSSDAENSSREERRRRRKANVVVHNVGSQRRRRNLRIFTWNKKKFWHAAPNLGNMRTAKYEINLRRNLVESNKKRVFRIFCRKRFRLQRWIDRPSDRIRHRLRSILCQIIPFEL